MKNLYLYIIIVWMLCFVYPSAFSQGGMWTWVKGTNVVNDAGNYGALGVPSANNNPPCRYAPGFWTDTSGAFWLYGGMINYGGSSFRADLWKFDPVIFQWTWMSGSQSFGIKPDTTAGKGVFSSTTQAGSLGWGMYTWVTPDNHFWIFGGYGTPTIKGNLWQFDPVINQWAWMGDYSVKNSGSLRTPGSSNSPGARYEANTSWVDASGNLCLFGGYNGFGGPENDVWKYNVATGIWTWMSGSSVAGSIGNYGTQGIPSVNNAPYARYCNLSWTDSTQNFWLSGGTFGGVTDCQDVWRYNPATYEWTWMSGTQVSDTSHPKGNLCEAKPANKEGGRYENRAVWKLCDNLVINYGGFARFGIPSYVWNDLWAYEMTSREWIKLAQGTAAGSYGTQGVPSATNYPPVRVGSAAFLGRDRNLWLFGGWNGNQTNGNLNYYNDLWKYTVDSACLGIYNCSACAALHAGSITALHDTVCPDQAPILSYSGTAGTVQWQYSTTGTNFNDLVGLTGPVCLDIPTQTSYYRVVEGSGSCAALSVTHKIIVNPSPQADFNASALGLDVTFNSAGSSPDIIKYDWNFGDSTHSSLPNPVHTYGRSDSFLVCLTVYNKSNCPYTVCHKIGVNISAEVSNLTNQEDVVIYPNPFSMNNVQLSITNELVGSKVGVYDESGRLIFQSEIRKQQSEIPLNVSGGVYLLRISSPKANIIRKLIRL